MKIFNLIKILVKTKFKFKKPKKSEIILYDQGLVFNNIVPKYFKKKAISIMYVRFEELNLYVLAKIFLNFTFLNDLTLFQNYVNEYCRLSKAKIVITTTLWDEKFLSLKKNYHPKIKLILVQPFIIKKSFFKILKNKKFIIDHCFIFDQESENILKKYYISNFIKIGSFKNNHFKKIKKKQTKNILLISGFKGGNLNNPKWRKIYFFEKKLVKIFEKIYFNKSNFKILLKPQIKKDDYIVFTGCAKKNVLQNRGNAYSLIDKYDLIITIHGSMGKEALSRGLKHIEIPHIYYKNSPFYVFKKKPNLKNLKLSLNYFSSLSVKKFFQIYKRKQLQKFYYDERNIIFRGIIRKNLMI